MIDQLEVRVDLKISTKSRISDSTISASPSVIVKTPPDIIVYANSSVSHGSVPAPPITPVRPIL